MHLAAKVSTKKTHYFLLRGNRKYYSSLNYFNQNPEFNYKNMKFNVFLITLCRILLLPRFHNSILVPLVKLVQRELLSNRCASKPRTTHQVCRCRKISHKFSIHKVLQFLCNSLEFFQLGKTNLFNNISG